MTERKVKEVFTGRSSQDGAGVKLNRIFGYYETPKFDPFLLMDFFDSKNPEDYTNGFPWHPHRGIETITYLISGEIEHGDSLGNQGVIRDGQCQWMTAGSGIIHQEMPQESDHLFGVQIWLNMPAEHKMSQPVYRDITKKDINVYREENLEVKVISGQYKEIKGPVQSEFVKTNLFDVTVHADEFIFNSDPNSNLAVFILEGSGLFDETPQLYGKKNALLFTEGERLTVKTDEKVRFLLLNGDQINEPIAWRGPVVMNTEQELDVAFNEISKNKFIKHKNLK